MSGQAPQRFAEWMAAHEHRDPVYGWAYRYHPRSDAHSVTLCEYVLLDLLAGCAPLREQARDGRVVYGINYKYTFPLNRKKKTLDLVIGSGTPDTLAESVPGIYKGTVERLRLACECKTAMTEHAKSQPRIFDELSSSHEIVHQGEGPDAIAAGIAVVNIAKTFVSPLRQQSAELFVSKHNQPRAAEKMVNHLRGLPLRDQRGRVGFDAYATIVIDCDNQGPAGLWTEPPAPQPGDADHYATFVERVSRAYIKRFGK